MTQYAEPTLKIDRPKLPATWVNVRDILTNFVLLR